MTDRWIRFGVLAPSGVCVSLVRVAFVGTDPRSGEMTR